MSYSPTILQRYSRVLSVNITLPYLYFKKCSTGKRPITVKELAARCQVFYRKIYGFFLQCIITIFQVSKTKLLFACSCDINCSIFPKVQHKYRVHHRGILYHFDFRNRMQVWTRIVEPPSRKGQTAVFL